MQEYCVSLYYSSHRRKAEEIRKPINGKKEG
jgi:hypothetical protein